MNETLRNLLKWTLRFGAIAIVANEIRGLILAAPVIYAMYHAGGSLMAIWLGICSLGGIALSVVVPVIAAKKLRPLLGRAEEIRAT